MQHKFAWLVLGVSLFSAAQTQAAPPVVPTAEELSSSFRRLLLAALPNPLVEQQFNWGHQEMTANGIFWEKKGLIRRPKITKEMQNEGTWRKIHVVADQPEKNLSLTVANIQPAEPGRYTFSVNLTMKTNILFEQQVWKNGIRLYSGETRARSRVVLKLDCESTSRSEKKEGALFPELIFRMRVLKADLNYDNFVVEHTAGIGGDGAKLLGEAVHETIRQWKPSLERNMLDKANAAIVKAGDTKEVRVGLTNLFSLPKK